MAIDTTPSLSSTERRFRDNRQEYQDHLPLTERAQADLRDDVELLQSQEGWNLPTRQGIAAWVEDKDNVFRFLRRNSFDLEKTRQVLLAALTNRITHSLHLAIPSIPPYSNSPLFYVLPPYRYTDRLGRPIAVLTIREVVRDENGKLEDLGQWIWWTSELMRRTLQDYWAKGKWREDGQRGYGGEGCVAIVDAGSAGYRNIEVELLPTLGAVGPKNFPGMIDAAYIVNAGWTQRSLWKVTQKLVPKSAMEKIRFLDSSNEVEEFFDLDRLPKAYGGHDPYTFSPADNPVFKHYQRTSVSPATELPPSRATSFASAADIFYSATNTPLSSPGPSRLPGSYGGLLLDNAVRAYIGPSIQVVRADSEQGSVSPMGESPSEDGSMSSASSSRPTSSSRRSSLTPMQRIKSLTNFHLYLSPSRFAQVDLLSDSSDDDPRPRRAPRAGHLEPSTALLFSRRTRPPLAVRGIPDHLAPDQQVRSYSDQLQQHHAQRLERLDGRAPLARTTGIDFRSEGEQLSSESSQPPSQHVTLPEVPRPISAFSRSTNPWFGYPAILIPDTSYPGNVLIRPRYKRNRKRDLVKTLLFLFVLRLQSWRDTFERTLGLGQQRQEVPKDPGEGLLMAGQTRSKGTRTVSRSRAVDKDWIWMAIGFLLLRGTSWTRLIVAPLEAFGLESVRDLLGLI